MNLPKIPRWVVLRFHQGFFQRCYSKIATEGLIWSDLVGSSTQRWHFLPPGLVTLAAAATFAGPKQKGRHWVGKLEVWDRAQVVKSFICMYLSDLN